MSLSKQEESGAGVNFAELDFQISKRCDSGACIGMKALDGTVYFGDVQGGKLRQDYPDTQTPAFGVTAADTMAFLEGIRNGAFDR